MALILCPRCRTLLRESGGASRRRCLSCSGVFVLREAMGPLADQLRAGRAEAVVSAPYRTMAITDAEPDPPQLESDFRYRRCPFCSKHMNRAPIVEGSGVVVDLCVSHGAWFDGAEIRRVIDHVQQLTNRRRQAAEASGESGETEVPDPVALVLDTFFKLEQRDKETE
jgi:Zn-finger nucleic acid-binding protein